MYINQLIHYSNKFKKIGVKWQNINVRQDLSLELAFVGFIVLYLGWWAYNLLKGQKGDEAYMNIPFEKEAYANHDNPIYILNRKRYAWIRYISS